MLEPARHCRANDICANRLRPLRQLFRHGFVSIAKLICGTLIDG
jgi:hypothetical protein